MMRRALIIGSVVVFSYVVQAHGPAAWIMNGPYYSILTDQPNTHCCGPSDCEMWPVEDVSMEADGYHLKSTGEVIPYNKSFYTEAAQVKVSMFWRCHTYEVLPQFKNMPPGAGIFGPVHPSFHYKTRCFFGPGGAT